MTSNFLSFPQRVHNVLKICEEHGREDIISWVNNGTAFRVNDLQAFERELLPKYFNTKKYYSFTRTLYAYGFTCARAGRQTGIYSHPYFNRNDPISPSLMKRVTKKESRKAAPPNHAVSNSFIEALNNRTASLRPGVLNGQQICQFPPIRGEARREDNGSSATVFGRDYHTIGSQVADREASQSVHHNILTGSELTGIFDGEGDSMDKRSYPIPTPSTSTIDPTSLHAAASSSRNGNDRQSEGKPIAPNSNLFILGSGHMAPIVASSRAAMNVSEQENKGSLMPLHVPDRHARLKEPPSDDFNQLPL